MKSRRARRPRPTGGKSRAGMPVAPCAAAGHCSGARTFSPPRARRAWRGPCARPLAGGLGSPRSQGKARSARPMRLGLIPSRPWRETQKTACGIGHAHFLHSIQHSTFKIGRRQPPLCASAPLRENPHFFVPWCLGGSTPFSIADFGLKSRRARRPRPTGGKSRAGMPVAPCAAAGHCSGARTFSPPRARRAWRGPCARPLACGLGSPRSQGKARSARPMRLGLIPSRPWRETQTTASGIGHAAAQEMPFRPTPAPSNSLS